MTEFGNVALIDGEEDHSQALSLPGVTKGDMSSRFFKPEVNVSGVKFSPTGKYFNRPFALAAIFDERPSLAESCWQRFQASSFPLLYIKDGGQLRHVQSNYSFSITPNRGG